mgnify:FL=1|tara:strand:+ start:1742 stop:2686 length:945 start_codon:yes stop_codon:yes gene_type:complete
MTTLTKETVKSPSLDMLFDGFLSGYKSTNSIKSISSNVSRFIDFVTIYCMEKRVSLKKGDALGWNVVINCYMNKNSHRWKTNQAYNTNLSNIKKFLGFCKIINPVDIDHKSKKVELYNNVQVLPDTSMQNLLFQLKANRNMSRKAYRDYVLFTMLYVTGIRKGELISLTHQSIIESPNGYEYQVIGKGNKEIRKPLDERLYHCIKELKKIENKQDHDFIFTGSLSQTKINYNKMSNKAINKILNTHLEKMTGSKGSVRVHSIRALSAYKIYRYTNSIKEAQKHLNHASSSTTDIYLDKLDTKRTMHKCFEDILD